MAKSDVQRKLTAILVTDVVGYSLLMGDDPEGTLATLTEYRKVFSNKIQEYKGRVVNAPGDSLLADFPSVVDAVSCAVDIQRELAERNQEFSDERRMDFRIGINLGDVLVKDGDIYGDGVNVAARLESLAEPGGICISGDVHNQVKKRLSLHFESMGEQNVKNIADPIMTYMVLSKPGAAAHRVVKAKQSETAPAPVHGPERPSIAVLAFDNMSPDPEQEYFGEGISEDIITDLSKITGLLVIGRNSSFHYKGKNVDLRQIGRELGVQYILEGSVRKVGNKVRTTAQLIEAATGHHIWADRFDKELNDIFLIGDEITEEIVTALDVKLVRGEQARIFNKALKSPKAREFFNRGVVLINQPSKDNLVLALEMFQAVIQEETDSPIGYAYSALALVVEVMQGWNASPSESTQEAEILAKKGLEFDAEFAAAHGALAFIDLLRGEHDQAVTKSEQSVACKPVCSGPKSILASILTFAGRPEEAIPVIRDAMRINPVYPEGFLQVLGRAFYLSGKSEEAIGAANAILERNAEDFGARLVLACAYGDLGREEEAQAVGQEILRFNPNFTVSGFAKTQRFKYPADLERITNEMSKAGLPE